MKFKFLAFLVLGLLLLPACTSAQPPDQVTVQLKWVHQAQFAGIYVAQEQGYFAEENLDVTILEGGPGINPLESLFNGEADFTLDSALNCLQARSEGNSVVAIAAIYRHNPTVFVSMPSSNIKQPADFIGKKVAVSGSSDYEPQLNTIIERLDLDMSKISIVPHSYDLAPLYSGEIDVLGVYAIGGLIRAQQGGYDLNVIWPSDYGVHSYADVLISTDEYLQENPEVATRFLRAVLRGWNYAVGNPDQAVEHIMMYALEADPETQQQMMSGSLPLVHTGEDQIGWMRPEVWQDMHDLYLEQGVINTAVELNRVYRMDFLNSVYGEQ